MTYRKFKLLSDKEIQATLFHFSITCSLLLLLGGTKEHYEGVHFKKNSFQKICNSLNIHINTFLRNYGLCHSLRSRWPRGLRSWLSRPLRLAASRSISRLRRKMWQGGGAGSDHKQDVLKIQISSCICHYKKSWLVQRGDCETFH